MRRGFGVLILAVAIHAGDDLVDRLRSDDGSVLGAAINEVQRLPPAEAAKLAPRALKVDQPLVRQQFVQILGRLDGAAAPLVPELVAAAFDEDPSVRSQATYALSQLGPAAWSVLPLLPDLDPQVARALRQAAGAPDGATGDAWADEEWRRVGLSLDDSTDLAALEEGFHHPHPYVQYRAAAAVVRRGEAALPAIEGLATDPSVRVRRRAVNALLELYRLEGAVPLLAAALRDPDAAVRTSALAGLGAAGATATIEEYAKEIDGPTLISTTSALEQAKPGASHALLRRVLRSDDPTLRMMAAQQISRMGPSARPLLPDMVDSLFDEYPPVHDAARQSLLAIGGTPDEVVPWLRAIPGLVLDGAFKASTAELPLRVPADATAEDLAKALAGEDAIAAGQAAAALAAREPKGAATARLLAAALRHPSSFVRFKAAAALAAYGDRGVYVLATAVEDESVRVRWRVIVALGSMGAAARDAVPAIVTQLDGVTLWPACEALMKLGPGAAAALPAVLAMLKGEDDAKANSAMGIIAAIGDEAKPAIPLLIEALDDKERGYAAAGALGSFGRDAEAAVPKLRRMIRESSDEWPDFSAFQALLRIGGEGHRAVAEMFLSHPGHVRDARNYIRAMNVGSSELVETLLELSKSTNGGVAASARDALTWVQPTKDLDPARLVAAMELGGWGDEGRARALAEKATVGELVQALASARGWGAWGAVVALGLKGSDAREAAPAVARCLKESAHYPTRVAAARALFLIRGREAESDLVDALRGRMPAELMVAIEKTLAEIGDVAFLAAALEDAEGAVRGAAVRALGRLDPPPKDAVRALVKNLWSNERYVPGVERLLVSMKAEALPLVAALLQVDDEAVVSRATEALVKMGPDAFPYLVTSLQEADPIVRIAAVHAIGRFGAPGRPELRRVVREDTHRDVRAAALTILLEKSPDLEAARAALDDPDMCEIAIRRLVVFGDRAVAMEFLAEALGHVTSRASALRSFQWIVPAAAVPALRRAATEKTGEAQAGAALGLARAGELHVEGLRACVRSEDRETRLQGLSWLATAGPEAAPAMPEILLALDLDDATARRAVVALGSIGPAAAAELPALRARARKAPPLATLYAIAFARIEDDMARLAAILEAGDKGIRDAVWTSLGDWGVRELGELVARTHGDAQAAAVTRLSNARDRAVPVALGLLRHGRADVRAKAASVLGSVGRGPDDVVSALVKALEDPDPGVRAEAVVALGRFGAAAAAALPTLEKLRKDASLRESVDEAIGRIR